MGQSLTTRWGEDNTQTMDFNRARAILEAIAGADEFVDPISGDSCFDNAEAKTFHAIVRGEKTATVLWYERDSNAFSIRTGDLATMQTLHERLKDKEDREVTNTPEPSGNRGNWSTKPMPSYMTKEELRALAQWMHDHARVVVYVGNTVLRVNVNMANNPFGLGKYPNETRRYTLFNGRLGWSIARDGKPGNTKAPELLEDGSTTKECPWTHVNVGRWKEGIDKIAEGFLERMGLEDNRPMFEKPQRPSNKASQDEFDRARISGLVDNAMEGKMHAVQEQMAKMQEQMAALMRQISAQTANRPANPPTAASSRA